MKFRKTLSLLFAIVLLFVFVIPTSAQLGDTDGSSFTIQNVDTVSAQVTVAFVDETGFERIPNPLNGSKPNPFTLAPGESWEVVVPQIPVSGLPNGRYSVVVSATARVVAIANVAGKGTKYYTGSYQGFESAANTFYLPAAAFNYYGWYSLVSAQNLGEASADVTLTITCAEGTGIGTPGVLTRSALPSMASHHFVLKETVPVGWTPGTTCNGAAKIEATQPIVVSDNQSVPGSGRTQSFSGIASGFSTLFVPALYFDYSSWNASLNILKLTPTPGSSVLVSIVYSNAHVTTCTLTDAAPSCLRMMKIERPAYGYFAAKIISSDPNVKLAAVANAALGIRNQAQTYNAVGEGSHVVGIPAVYNLYYGWRSSFTCQNVSSFGTPISIQYEPWGSFGGYTYVHPNVIPHNGTVEVIQRLEPFLPLGYRGGVTVTALDPNAEIACIQNYTNPTNLADPSKPGDWSTSNNAFPK